jgi:competence protein ComEA
VKQNPPPAKSGASLSILLIIGLTVFISGCSTTSVSPTAIQNQVDKPKSDSGQLVNINNASAEELESLPGIGKAIAERIIAHRQRYGPFRRAEHLLIVRGISDRKFRALRPMITAD